MAPNSKKMAAAKAFHGGKDSKPKASDHMPKIGRKGDPRMHRALQARLANPELSLFGALQIGGFEYEHDDDPLCVDSENIALGQRKNQLSRRLRLARKSDIVVESDDGELSISESSKCSSGGVHRKMGASKRPPKRLAGQKRNYSEEASEDGQNGDAHANSLKELQERLALEQQRHRDEPKALAAKHHPDFHHIIIPRTGTGSAVFPSAASALQPGALAVTNDLSVQEQLMANGITGGLSGFALSAAAKSPSSMPPPAISNVAIRSLNATARSVGITLEQLALALSTSKNLVQLLSGISSDSDSDTGESRKKKEELALRLYEYETKTLYSRCMLLADFTHDEAAEGNPTQLRFALEAWQKEGKRLQELLKNNADIDCDEAPLIHNVAEQDGEEVTSRRSQVSLPKKSKRKCQFSGGRHIHRLDGQCGHRAILHQPAGGTAHIDFVVGDKVECYGGLRKTQDSSVDGNAVWPSRYRCDELDCGQAEECSKAYVHGEHEHSSECTKENKAKLLDLDSIDLSGKEWTVDFDDGVLMSLFRLSDNKTSTDQTSARSVEYDDDDE